MPTLFWGRKPFDLATLKARDTLSVTTTSGVRWTFQRTRHARFGWGRNSLASGLRVTSTSQDWQPHSRKDPKQIAVRRTLRHGRGITIFVNRDAGPVSAAVRHIYLNGKLIW